MKTASLASNAVVATVAKTLVVLLVAAVLGGYAGPVAIDAHDNLLFWVGCACFAAAGLAVLIGGLWIAASVRTLLGERNELP